MKTLVCPISTIGNGRGTKIHRRRADTVCEKFGAPSSAGGGRISKGGANGEGAGDVATLLQPEPNQDEVIKQ